MSTYRSILCLGVFLFLPVLSASGQTVGTCTTGQSDILLEANTVRARILNTGNLFWRGSPAVYEAPRGGGVSSLFTAGLWIGGYAEDTLRVAAARYGNYEFWPGPLDEAGNPPADCTPFDRIYQIFPHDVSLYETLGIASPRLIDWPWHLGAPVVDGDGDTTNYNLAGGDRPLLKGDQTLWWIMNDRGNVHNSTDTPALGLEVRAQAFASHLLATDLENSTFYQYDITYKGDSPLEDAYIGFFVDPDVGNFDDDYIGSDTTLGIGFAYNADNNDEGHYGFAPPAVGTSFLQGPRVDQDGLDNDRDGRVDEAGEVLSMTTFAYFTNGGSVQSDPQTGEQYYNYMRGRWKDGQRFTFGGDGRSFSTIPTNFAFPGEPSSGAFWTEFNVDGAGTNNIPSDRRYVMSAGPFSMQPGDTQTITIGIVWARGSDHLDSVSKLKASPVFQLQGLHRLPPSSTFFSVITAPLTLEAPGEGALQQPRDAALHWTPVSEATGYIVQLAKQNIFDAYDDLDPTAPQQITSVEVRDRSFVANLDANTTYYWRVLPFTDRGYGTWSTASHFTTSAATQNKEEADFEDFQVVANANGPLTEPAGASADWQGYPGIGNALNGGQPQQSNGSTWHISTGGQRPSYAEFISRTTRAGSRWPVIAPYDYELRFTASGGKCLTAFATERKLIDVPFELWRVGVGTFDDPSDDVRLFCHMIDQDNNDTFNLLDEDHPSADGMNDPYTDWFYWVLPSDQTPGTTGYEACLISLLACHISGGAQLMDRMVLVNWNGGDVAGGIYNADMPEEGTVFRIITTPPSKPTLSAPTDGYAGLPETVTLWWHGNATHLQVATDSTFAPTSLVVDINNLSGSSHTVTGLQNPQTYYWRSSNYGAWSATWHFTIGSGVSREAISSDRPTRFALDQNYPNPFNPTTTFRFGLPQASHTTINVYNALGQHIATVLDGAFDAGWHTVQWSASGLSSGLYFYQITAGAYQETRKMMMLK